ncbi:MAG: cytochrome c oxidase subunit II [Croceimicrobium sp.]|nr:cytochrome c oxidase subunit II [Bacteroidota bacterium]
METLLIIVIALLAIAALTQAVRIFEISSQIKNSDSDVKVDDRDNNTQGWLMLLFIIFFFGAFAWQIAAYMDLTLPQSASEHGSDIDSLWDISMAVIVVAFLVTQPLLFGFAFRFRGNKNRKATYMEHNNKLELFWTGIPAVILAGLILYGLTTWSNVMNPVNEEEPMVIELYAKQFGWQARYAGSDNQLGYANVRLIEGVNTLGVDPGDKASANDVISNELRLPKGRAVLLKFRSQDVIHSAYLPHFRVQMNCVPGTQTQFQFTPSMTTTEMRQDPEVVEKVKRINGLRAERGEDPWEFDYVLLCNKICGSAHYNMQMKVVVEEQEDFDKWMKEQQTFAEML